MNIHSGVAVRRYRFAGRFGALLTSALLLGTTRDVSAQAKELSGALQSSKIGDTKAIPDSDVLRDLILNALETNDEKLGAVAVTTKCVAKDKSVDAPITVTGKSESGGEFTWTRAPSVEFVYQITFHCEKLKCVQTLEEGRSRTWIRDGDTWTQYNPAKRLALIRSTYQMAALVPFDPRELVMDDIRQPLRQFVRTSKVSALPIDGNGLKAKRGMLRAESTDKVGQRYTVDFDPEFGLLPVQSMMYRSDGTIYAYIAVRYQRVLARNAYILESSIAKCYPKNTRDTSANWTTSATTTLTDMKLIETEKGKEDAIFSLPQDVRIEDLRVTVRSWLSDVLRRIRGSR